MDRPNGYPRARERFLSMRKRRDLAAGERDDVIEKPGEDLMRQLETRERELGRPLTDAEQEALVEEKFAPLRVAARSEGAHLAIGRLQIGPRLFPLYWKILCLNVGLTLAVFAVYALVTGEPIGTRWSLFDVLLQAGIITAIFALADAGQRKPVPPRDLLGLYLRAVARHLPREQRADIVEELSENLLAQIEDEEAQLGRPLTAADTEALLKRHGHPLLVAGRFQADQRSLAFGRQLIGPALFPFYARVLRLNLWITLAACLAAAAIVELAGRPILPALPILLLPFVVQFAVVTVIFVGLEIYLRRFPDRWNPRDLPDHRELLPGSPLDTLTRHVVGPEPPRVPRLESLAQLVFTALFFFWWLAVPRQLPFVFPPGKSFLQPGPGWWAFYQPVLWIAAVGMVQPLLNLLFPHWTLFRAAMRTATTALFMAVLGYTLEVGSWVVPAPAAGDPSAHLQVVAAIDRWCRTGVISTLAVCALILALEIRRLLLLWRGRAPSAQSSPLAPAPQRSPPAPAPRKSPPAPQ
jgi:hypothetical protein